MQRFDESRRRVLQAAGAAAGLGALGACATTAPVAEKKLGRVLVVGAGYGGATAAKYLKLWGGAGIEVMLIDRETAFVSCPLSNLVLGGSRRIEDLTIGYEGLRRQGVVVLSDEVRSIDPAKRKVTFGKFADQTFDRIVVSPGIDFNFAAIQGLDAEAQKTILHAWKAGPQTVALRRQLEAMPDGGVYVLTVPLAPYRCPPGPYERACVVADWLKKNRAGSKVIVLDANPGITAEPLAFTNAFDVVHKGVVEYHPGVTINSIDASTMTLNTSLGNLKAKVINAIPPHKAGKVVINNGLANVGGRWAGVDVLTYQSTAAPGIHVIGDASATTQPKAGHIANQEAKTCADAIVRLLAGRSPDPSPITNSACYSPITADTASWLTAVFAYDPVSRTMQPVPGAAGEAAARSQDNYNEMFKWFNTLMEDSFA